MDAFGVISVLEDDSPPLRFASPGGFFVVQESGVARDGGPANRGGSRGMEKEKGVVKWFDERKGYGFISRESGEGDIFVHHSAILGEGFKTLNEGDRVEYVVTQGRKGPAAGEVKKL